METTTVLAFIVGVSIGGMLCAFGAQRGWRRVRRETTAQLKQSGEIQDRHYSATAMVYRSALEKIEAGDIEGAKSDLSHSIAIYYQTHTEGRRELASVGIQPDEPDWIGRELRAIENDARRFKSLRAALERRQNEPAV